MDSRIRLEQVAGDELGQLLEPIRVFLGDRAGCRPGADPEAVRRTALALFGLPPAELARFGTVSVAVRQKTDDHVIGVGIVGITFSGVGSGRTRYVTAYTWDEGEDSEVPRVGEALLEVTREGHRDNPFWLPRVNDVVSDTFTALAA